MEKGFCLRAVRTEFLTYFRLISVFKGLKDGPWGRAVQGVGLRPLACRDCVFESHGGGMEVSRL